MYAKEIPTNRRIPSKIGVRDTPTLQPSAAEKKESDHIYDLYCELESASNHLQEDKATISDVCTLFDAIIVTHPTSPDRLSQTAMNIVQPDFENDVVKSPRRSHYRAF